MSEEKEEVDLSSLNESDQKMFLSNRLKIFKFTILTCILYAFVAGLLLIVMMFTKWGQENIYKNMGYFVTTFIIGTFIMIFTLIYYINNFKPTRVADDFSYDAEICPDYWKLEYVDPKTFKDAAKTDFFNEDRKINQNHFKYKCSMDKSIFSTEKMARNGIARDTSGGLVKQVGTDGLEDASLNEEQQEFMNEYLQNMNGYTSNTEGTLYTPNNTNATDYIESSPDKTTLPMSCDKVYPTYLSTMDKQYSEKHGLVKSNIFRCAYAKLCDVPWTEAGC